MNQKKRNENRWNTHRHKPFISDVTWRLERQPFCSQFFVKLSDQWLQFRSFHLQSKLGNPPFEQLLVAEIHPIGGGIHAAAKLTRSLERGQACGYISLT